MFNKEKRYISRQANEIVPVEIQILMWNMIDKLKSQIKLDYLQIFRLRKQDDKVIMEHEQEVPQYKEKYVVEFKDIEIAEDIKIYVIDSVEYSTMILNSEY